MFDVKLQPTVRENAKKPYLEPCCLQVLYGARGTQTKSATTNGREQECSTVGCCMVSCNKYSANSAVRQFCVKSRLRCALNVQEYMRGFHLHLRHGKQIRTHYPGGEIFKLRFSRPTLSLNMTLYNTPVSCCKDCM